MESKSVAQTIIDAAQSRRDILAYNYASEALNNSFFLECLVSPSSRNNSTLHY